MGITNLTEALSKSSVNEFKYEESRLDGTPIRLIPLGRPAYLAHLVSLETLGPLGALEDLADLVVLDVHLPQESRVALVFHASRVFQGHHVLLASQRDQLGQLPLVVQDNLGLPADLAVREYLAFPVVLLALVALVAPVALAFPVVLLALVVLAVLAVLAVLVLPGVPEGPLLAAVDTFRAVLGCSKWQAEIKPPKRHIPQ